MLCWQRRKKSRKKTKALSMQKKLSTASMLTTMMCKFIDKAVSVITVCPIERTLCLLSGDVITWMTLAD